MLCFLLAENLDKMSYILEIVLSPLHPLAARHTSTLWQVSAHISRALVSRRLSAEEEEGETYQCSVQLKH